MERNGSMLWALFAGVEPIIIGLVSGRQRLVLVGLCNLFIILLRNSSQQKTGVTGKVFSYRSNLEGLKVQNNYFGAIAFVALIGGIIAFILGKFNQLGNLAFGLVIAGVIFRVFAVVTHGLKTTWYTALAKIFGLLILVGAGRMFLGTTNGQSFFNELPTRIKNIFAVPAAVAPGTQTTTSTGAQATGTQLTGTMTTGSKSAGNATSGATGSTQPSTTVVKDSKTALTFAQVIPVLVDTYKLSTSGPEVSFANISRTSPLYSAFKAGYNVRFYGVSVNPSAIVSCNVYLVLVGIAEKRNVSYNSSSVFTAYAAEASKRGKTFGCVPGASVTEANLPK